MMNDGNESDKKKIRTLEEKKHISRPFFAALNLFAINSRQAGPDAPHEAESAAPWSLFN
jgi:hypothetical protein